MPLVLILFSTTVTVLFLAAVVGSGRNDSRLVPFTDRVDHLQGRILFVAARDDNLVLDCVAVVAHPARCALPAGTPFTLEVDPKGPPWFLGAVARMVMRWAADDTVIDFDVVTGSGGNRVDVRGDRSRVRFDMRAHAGLG